MPLGRLDGSISSLPSPQPFPRRPLGTWLVPGLCPACARTRVLPALIPHSPRFLLGPQSRSHQGPSGSLPPRSLETSGLCCRLGDAGALTSEKPAAWGDVKTTSLGRPSVSRLALRATRVSLAGSQAPLPTPDQASERLSAHRASARGRIRARTRRAGALRSPEICPSEGLLPTVAPPRLKLPTRRLRAQDSSPRGSRAGAPRRSLPGMLCERAGRDAPLQTATRTWVFCFLFFGLFFFFFLFPPLLSVPRPPASRSPPASGPRPNGAAFTIVQIQARVCLGV